MKHKWGTCYRSIISLIMLMGMTAPLGCIADSVILGQNNEPIDPGTAHRRLIRVGGRLLECWVARSPGAKGREPAAYVLFFIGKGDRADRWIVPEAQGWGERPVEVWGMNYPGSGGSEGPPQLKRIGPAAVAAYDAMKRVAGSRPIFIRAASLGTAAALAVAARRPVSGLILQNPPPLRELILGEYGWWNLWLLAGPAAMQLPADLDSIVNAARSRAPAVFLLAGADEIIPPEYHTLVVAAYAGPKRIIQMPGAHHSDPLSNEAAQQLAKGIDWLWQRQRLKVH